MAAKKEYLEQLGRKLRILPEEERGDALEYYEGYLNDAEDEEAAIARLGTPAEVAANILIEHAAREPDASGSGKRTAGRKGAGGIRMAWFVIIAIFALPVGLPVLVAVGAVAFSVFVALLATIISLGFGALAILLVGLAGILLFPFIAVQDLGLAVFYCGTGLLLLGTGMLIVSLTVVLSRGFKALARFVGRTVSSRRKKNA